MTGGGLAPWQLRNIDRYIRENVATSLSLQVLSEQINMSASHFGRSFKMSRGFTPHMYITRVRLDLAQSLMLTTSDPICDIALTCGLADQAHLTKLFRRRFGETPAAWRRRHFNEDGPGAARGGDVVAQVAPGVPAQTKTFATLDQNKGHKQKSCTGDAAGQRLAARRFQIFRCDALAP
jgi:AraC-like DNA-binding protein